MVYKRTTKANAADRLCFAYLKAENGEDPARFLAPAVDLDPIPRIARLETVEDCDNWLYVARCLSVDYDRIDTTSAGSIGALIRARREFLTDGAPDETPESEADHEVDAESDAVDGEETLTDAGATDTSETQPPTDDVNSQNDDDRRDDNAPFEELVDDAYRVAKSFSKDDLQERLLDEAQGDDPREHVIAAINRRLRELDAETDQDDDDADDDADAVVAGGNA